MGIGEGIYLARAALSSASLTSRSRCVKLGSGLLLFLNRITGTHIIGGFLTRRLFYFERLCLERLCLLACMSTRRFEVFGGRSEVNSGGIKRSLGLGKDNRLPLLICNSLSMPL